MEFGQYKELAGLSHSYLKREKFGVVDELEITDNIRVGSIVDGILTDPKSVNYHDPLYFQCREIAHFIKEKFGYLINGFEKQVSYTAEIKHKGFKLFTTGRLDFLIPGHAVIDLKITASKNIPQLVEYMGYPNQLWHYCRMAGVKKRYLIVYSKPLRQCFLYQLPDVTEMNEFWAGKILKFGEPDE